VVAQPTAPRAGRAIRTDMRTDLSPAARTARAQARHNDAGLSNYRVERGLGEAHARDPNPGDAWDHAIKGVEAVLIPIVVPKKDKPNLGDVIGQLRGQPHLWKLGMRGQNRDNSVEPLVGMLTLLRPDPNRHGSPTPEPPASPEEGRAMMNLAATLVQWARDAQILKR
jgi:hypothetical protein